MQASSTLSTNWLLRLLRLWSLFALLTFGVLLMHHSDDGLLFNRYSALVTAQLAGLLLVALSAWGSRIYLGRRPDVLTRIENRLARWRGRTGFIPLVLLAAAVLLCAVWLLFLGNHLPTYAMLRLFAAASILIGALSIAYGGSQATETVSWRFFVGFMVCLLGIFALLTLSFFPALARADEAFVFSMARNMAENGQFRPLIYQQVFPEYYYGGLWIHLMGAWLRVAPISLASARLYNLVLGMLSIGLIGVATSRLYNRTTAYAVLVIGAYAFITTNHIRFDIHAALWLSAGIFFYSLTDKPTRWWAHVLTGLAVGLCIDSNPIGYSFGLGLALVYGWAYVRVIRRERRWLWPPFWLMAVGGLVALVIYLLMHAGSAFAGDETTMQVLAGYWETIRENWTKGQFISQLGQFFTVWLTRQPIIFALALSGLWMSLRTRGRGDSFLVMLFLAWTAVVIFAYFYFPSFYMVLALPLVVILAARGVVDGIPWLLGQSAPSAALNRASLGLLGVWFGAALAYQLVHLPSQSLEDVVAAGEQMAQIVPQQAVVVGAEPYYFGMLDHPNFVGGVIENWMYSFRNISPQEAWLLVAPDALIFSEGWPTEPSRSPALLSYMDAHGFGLQACYLTDSYGRVELWTRDAAPGGAERACTRICNPRTGCPDL